MFRLGDIKIGVIGLGYVGLPLAVAFAEKYGVMGFDINIKRVDELNNSQDNTGELANADLIKVLQPSTGFTNKGLRLTDQLSDLSNCNVYIITVPTLIFENNEPNFSLLFTATKSIATLLKKDDIVIFESTVYPGVTEEECVPILETVSGLQFNTDFFVGYSPERINPGDKKNTLKSIVKLTSGSDEQTRLLVDNLYSSIIDAGTYSVSCIKVAEAAKVIENTQRDINIAFVNELAKIFAPMDIPTQEVLQAAGTKWNFLKFSPGLVGGHCIGINPYFLAHKSIALGYTPKLILDSRNINESMPSFVADQVVLQLAKRKILPQIADVLILGTTFKENCGDIRNSKVKDLMYKLTEYEVNLSVYDPIATGLTPEDQGLMTSMDLLANKQFHCIVLAVAHTPFLQTDWTQYLAEDGFVYDIKGFLPQSPKVIRL